MTPVRMVHEKHGAMHVYDAQEMKRLEAIGWKSPVEPEPKPELKKRGRPRKA